MAEISGLNLVTVDPFGPNTNIISAIATAAAAPGGAVWIPASYVGTDTVPAGTAVPVFDMRSGGNIGVGNVSGVSRIQAASSTAAAPVTNAAGGVFTPTLNLPGASKFEGVPFKVRASGWAAVSGGTWTATMQPLIFASAVAGYTASVAAAVYSSAAINVTIAQALATTITYVPWELEVVLEGDSTAGKLTGRSMGSYRSPLGVVSALALTAIANPTTVGTLNMASTVPIQFLAGVTMGGTKDTGVDAVVNLNSFYIMPD